MYRYVLFNMHVQVCPVNMHVQVCPVNKLPGLENDDVVLNRSSRNLCFLMHKLAVHNHMDNYNSKHSNDIVFPYAC